MKISCILCNLIALKRIVFSAPYSSQLFDERYASTAEAHALRAESCEEQELIIQWLRDQPLKPQQILDVGCNTGIPLDRLCEALECSGIGVDVNAAAISKANEGHRASCRFLLFDGDLLPFANHEFDHVVLHHVLGHVVDPDRTMQEIARVLRPGGTVSVITTNAWYQFWQTPLNFLNGFFPDRTVLRFYTASALERLLQKHGFGVEVLISWAPSVTSTTVVQHNFCMLRLIALARTNKRGHV